MFSASEMSSEIARNFVPYYYCTLHCNPLALGSLYHDGSMLNFNGQNTHGAENIVNLLTSLPFHHCHHHISTVDCQPSGTAGGFLVFVSGTLQLAGEQHALMFSQMFHLMPAGGRFYIWNDIFRFNHT